MSEELLSAMMDGECKPQEIEQLLAELDSSVALKARWSRMCATRDALAGVSFRKNSIDLTASVMAALDDLEDTENGSNVVPLRRATVTAPARVAARARRMQPLVGYAAAASLAIAAVVGGRSYWLPSATQTLGPVATSEPVVGAQAVAFNAESATQSADEPVETRWTQLDADSARQLNDYLMEHSNSRAESGMGGSLSYARLTVRTADYRPAAEPR